MEKNGSVAFYHLTIPCEPNKGDRHVEIVKFVPVLTTMCMLGVKFLEVFCLFLCD